jgi:hypothetical protein
LARTAGRPPIRCRREAETAADPPAGRFRSLTAAAIRQGWMPACRLRSPKQFAPGRMSGARRWRSPCTIFNLAHLAAHLITRGDLRGRPCWARCSHQRPEQAAAAPTVGRLRTGGFDGAAPGGDELAAAVAPDWEPEGCPPSADAAPNGCPGAGRRRALAHQTLITGWDHSPELGAIPEIAWLMSPWPMGSGFGVRGPARFGSSPPVSGRRVASL